MPRHRGLTAEETALWSRIAKTTVPLHPARSHMPEPQEQPHKPTPLRPAVPEPAPLPLGDFRIGATSLSKATTRLDLSSHPGQRLRGMPLRMDHGTHRKMSQGKLAPESRIDLHGMTLNVAQPQLVRFILNAHAQRQRLVLVITGKGRAAGPEAPLPVRPGALRHNVPIWLDMAPLNQLVLQVRPAHRRHGGDGAYYVYLRR